MSPAQTLRAQTSPAQASPAQTSSAQIRVILNFFLRLAYAGCAPRVCPSALQLGVLKLAGGVAEWGLRYSKRPRHQPASAHLGDLRPRTLPRISVTPILQIPCETPPQKSSLTAAAHDCSILRRPRRDPSSPRPLSSSPSLPPASSSPPSSSSSSPSSLKSLLKMSSSSSSLPLSLSSSQ